MVGHLKDLIETAAALATWPIFLAAVYSF